MAPLGRFRESHLDLCDSTNTQIKHAIERGEADGLVIRADAQTGGYGRRGNAWASPGGGLYFSILLRPSYLEDATESAMAQLSTVGLVVGIAVMEALREWAREPFAQAIRLKWPNDVVLEAEAVPEGAHGSFQKLCGISQEIYQGAVCVGVGINVFRPASMGSTSDGASTVGRSASPSIILDEGERNAVAYLEDLVPDPEAMALDAVLASVLTWLQGNLGLWEEEGFAPFASDYGHAMALRGSFVRLVDGEAVLGEGFVEGVSDAGALLLRSADDAIPFEVRGGHVLVLER